MIRNLSHISLLTNSLEKVKNFYIKKLKLKIIHEFRNDKSELYGLFINANKSTFLEFFLTKKKINFRNCKNHFRHICFEVNDIKKVNKKIANNKKKYLEGKQTIFFSFLRKILKGM